MTFIYSLLRPITGNVKYIGKSDNPQNRLKCHIRSAATGQTIHATSRWIVGLLGDGKSPVLKVLEEFTAERRWQDAEKMAIAQHIAAGCKLTNSTSGGQGLNLVRKEDRLALAASMSAAWNRPGAREVRCAALIAGNAKPEAVANRRAAAANPETKVKHAAALKANLFGNPELMACRRMSQTIASNDPDVKARKAAASKARWQDPAFRAAMYEKQKAAWVRRKQRNEPCTT